MPLHEREAELAVIEKEWLAACGGTGRLVVVEGPAGIGKTGLLREARAQLEPGMPVLSARAGELERHFPYGLVHQLLDPVVYGADDQDALFAGAAHMAAGLFADIDEAHPPGEDADAFPRLHGLFWLLANLAAREPLALVVDDAQWADDASLTFLTFLVRRLEAVPVLLLLATRPAHDAARPLLAQLVADAEARVLRPAELSQPAVAQLVRDALATEPDPAFAAACHEATRGNPLLVSELLREVAARRLPPDAAGARQVGALTSQGVAAVVELRLAGMPLGARAFAQAVAVLGEGGDQWTAAELAGLEDAEALAALDALVRGGLLDGGERPAFSHPLIRSTVYASADRALAHERAATLLRARRASPDAIATHLLVTRPAGDPEVVNVLRVAARSAAAVGAPNTAAAYLRRALAEPPADADIAGVCVELGLAAARSGAPDAEEHLRRAVELDATPRAALELGRWLKFAGRAVEAVGILEPALAEGGPEVEGEYLSTAYVSAGARRLIHSGLELELDARDPDLAALGLAARAFDAGASGSSATAAGDFAAGALAAGASTSDPVAGGYWCLIAGVGAMWADHFDLAERLMDSMLTEARRNGSAVGLRVASSMRSLLHYRLGALPDAETDARFAMSMNEEIGGADALVTAAHATLALVTLEGGASRPELEPLIAELEDPGLDTDALPYELVLHSRGCLRAALGDDRGGLDDLLAGGRFSTGWGQVNPAVVPWRSDAAIIAARLGEDELARELAGEELELARRFGAPRALGVALRGAALIAADEEQLAEAVAVLELSRARLELARALVDLGALVRRAGRRGEARDLLRRGLELAVRCGAERVATRGREELLATGSRPRRVALSGVEALTPSERRIAEMAAVGQTNRAIAQTLFVTEKTVEGHLGNAFAKLDIRSRTQLPQVLAA